jgi:hypothetical protein
MELGNFSEMKRCKMDWLDDIFYGTKESKGTRNAVNAIKLVLFDDYSVVPDGMNIGDKYEFISSRRDGRAKAKMLQGIDLIQILAKYALESFGNRNKNFEIDYNTYTIYRTQKMINMGFSNEFIVELVSYSLIDSIYGGYLFIASNNFIKNQLLDALIAERYIDNKANDLDGFNGELTCSEISNDIKNKYAKTFSQLDDDFFKIKRRDKEYINYSSETEAY